LLTITRDALDTIASRANRGPQGRFGRAGCVSPFQLGRWLTDIRSTSLTAPAPKRHRGLERRPLVPVSIDLKRPCRCDHPSVRQRLTHQPALGVCPEARSETGARHPEHGERRRFPALVRLDLSQGPGPRPSDRSVSSSCGASPRPRAIS
jgi:hypothetical protein